MRSTTAAIDALAVARLARLVTTDNFPPIEKLREAVLDRYPTVNWRGQEIEGHWFGELITCPWCSSVWIGAGVVAARAIAPRWWDPVAKLLAFSEVAGLAASHS